MDGMRYQGTSNRKAFGVVTRMTTRPVERALRSGKGHVTLAELFGADDRFLLAIKLGFEAAGAKPFGRFLPHTPSSKRDRIETAKLCIVGSSAFCCPPWETCCLPRERLPDVKRGSHLRPRIFGRRNLCSLNVNPHHAHHPEGCRPAQGLRCRP
jgi:hypothetical protein